MAVQTPALAAEEKHLIARAQNGDRQAYSELVRRHRSGVVNVIYRMSGDADLAEDIAQDAFIRAWVKLPSFQPRAPFRSWVYRIATNAALDHFRRRKETVDIDSLPLQSGAPGPESIVETKSRDEIVRAAVLALPPASRSVLVLREYEGLSYQAISDTLEIPLGTVMSRLNFARKKLAEQLKQVLEQG